MFEKFKTVDFHLLKRGTPFHGQKFLEQILVDARFIKGSQQYKSILIICVLDRQTKRENSPYLDGFLIRIRTHQFLQKDMSFFFRPSSPIFNPRSIPL